MRSFKELGIGPLIVGIVSPLGIDSDEVKKIINRCVADFGYRLVDIKISDIIQHEIIDKQRVAVRHSDVNCPPYDRIVRLMDAGDDFRGLANFNGVLAALAVARIAYIKEMGIDTEKITEKTIFVLDSLKNPGEVEFLKNIYGEAFLPIGFYSSRAKRHANVIKKLSDGTPDPDITGVISDYSDILINRDQDGGTDAGNGQDVREAFSHADAFISIDDGDYTAQLARLFELWFGHPWHTPTLDEYGMHLAASAALNSADLSRQVGAAILRNTGEIIALGYNEVPRPGGGNRWELDAEDKRDHVAGYDANFAHRTAVIKEVLEVLDENGWINRNVVSDIPQAVGNLVSGKISEQFKRTKIGNIIEYGRIIHAEMAAITEAARKEVSVQDAVLVCTTFPCHMCARHIISSGIAKVIYIEPYPKSLTGELYKGMVNFEPGTGGSGVVHFVPFIGVGPRRYAEFFGMRPRKDKKNGRAIKWDSKTAKPRITVRIFDIISQEESVVVDEVSKLMEPQPQEEVAK